MIKVFVRSLGTINEILDKDGYVLEDDATLRQLLLVINQRCTGDRFINVVLDEKKEGMGQFVFFFINGVNSIQLAGLDTQLADEDCVYILKADIAGG